MRFILAIGLLALFLVYAATAHAYKIGDTGMVRAFACTTAEEAVSVAKADQASNGDAEAIAAAIAKTTQCAVVTAPLHIRRIHATYPLADGTTTYVIEAEGQMPDGTWVSVWMLTGVGPSGDQV